MKRSIRLLCIGAAALSLLTAAACSGDPRATRLPADPKDIARVQAKLDKLPPGERQLVLDYLTRSKGTVLPVHLADPDAPLTARTFGEAIKLQGEFNARHAVEKENMEARRAAREAVMEPLRQALQVELVRREILSADEVTGRQPAAGQAINSRRVLVNTFLLRNTSAETMTRASGSVTVRAVSDPGSLMGLAKCFIERDEPIAAGQSIEVRCAHLGKQAGPADEDYVALPGSSLALTWEPRSITFAGGKVLAAGH